MDIDPTDLKAASKDIWAALDRVERDDGADVAASRAWIDVHANVAYLREKLGDVAVIELLGELRETVLHSTLQAARG